MLELVSSVKLSDGSIIYVKENGFTLDSKKAEVGIKIERNADTVYTKLVEALGRDKLTKLIAKNKEEVNTINGWLNSLSGNKAYFTKNRFLKEVYK